MDKSQHTEIASKVLVEQIRVLYRQSRVTLVAFPVLGLFVVYILWDTADHGTLIGWLAGLMVILLGRIILGWLYSRRAPADEEMIRWAYAAAVFSFLISSCFGVAAILFIEPEVPFNAFIITVVIIGMTAGSVVALASFMPSFFAFLLPSLFVLSVVLFLKGGQMGTALGWLTGLAIVVYTYFCLNVNRLLVNTFRLSFENIALRNETQEKNRLLETTLQNMNQGIALVGKEGTMTMWNENFFKLLNLPPPEESPLAPDKDDADLRLPLDFGDAARQEYVLDDQSVIEVNQNRMPDDSRVITLTDISERVRREKELEAARQEADEANVAKSRFLASASHDLRQPVHALGLFFESLDRKARTEETASLLDSVGESISVVKHMLDALLDVSKLEAGVVSINKAPVLLNEVLGPIRHQYQTVADEAGSKLIVDETDAIVETDPAMIERVLRNLVSNAINATEGGTVHVQTEPLDGQVAIHVKDSGRGIPEDQLEKIFEEFYQIENPQRDHRRGLGLGLAIVRRLSRLLGHEIRVQSTRGRGSCFSVLLPRSTLVPARGEAPASHRTIPASDRLDKRILVLDDDPSVVNAMARLLEDWGCSVATAHDLAEAEEHVRGRDSFDLFIVDYRLQEEQNGVNAIQRLNSIVPFPVPSLVITGDTAPDRLREAAMSGYSILHKPVEPVKLKTAIRYLTRRT